MPRDPALVPGYLWRSVERADAEDLQRMVAETFSAEGRPYTLSLEEVVEQLDDPYDDPRADARLAVSIEREEVAAMGWVSCRPEGERSYRAFLWGEVHPAHRSRGLGTAILGWMEERASERLLALPGELPRYLRSHVEGDQRDRIELLEGLGFRASRHYLVMRRNLEQGPAAAPLPQGVSLVRWSEDRSEQARVAHNEAFRDHWGSEPLGSDDWVRWKVGLHFRPELSLLALDGDEVVAYLVAHVYPEDIEVTGLREAWINLVGVRPPWRRRGLAAALVSRVMAAFRRKGFDWATLGVDRENPTGALSVYQRLGFLPVREEIAFTKQVGAPLGGAGG